MSLAPDTFPRCNLGEELMAQVVDLRARGESWEDTARAIEWDVADLRRVCRNDPGYNAAYEFAEREVAREDAARIRRALRKGLDDPDKEKARKAAEFFARYIAGERRDDTRLEVEQMRSEARQASAQARMAKEQARQAEKEPQLTAADEKQARDAFHNAQERFAEDLSPRRHLVYLWSGCHKLGGASPDETDIPLYLLADDTVPGGKIYWAVTPTPATDPQKGPFLPPPGKPI